MARIEYKKLVVEIKDVEDALNQWGNNGWELVSETQVQADGVEKSYLLLKRVFPTEGAIPMGNTAHRVLFGNS